MQLTNGLNTRLMSDFPVHATKTPAVVASRTVGRVQHAAKLLFSRQRTTHTELGCTMPSLCVCEIEQVRARERRGVGGRSRCAMWSRRARCQRRGEEAHNGSAVRWRGVTTTFLPNTPLVWVSLQPCSTQHKRHDTHRHLHVQRGFHLQTGRQTGTTALSTCCHCLCCLSF